MTTTRPLALLVLAFACGTVASCALDDEGRQDATPPLAADDERDVRWSVRPEALTTDAGSVRLTTEDGRLSLRIASEALVFEHRVGDVVVHRPGLGGEPMVRDGVVTLTTPHEETHLFATRGGLEELIDVGPTVRELIYELELPPRWRARGGADHPEVVELVDGQGTPRMRMVAAGAIDGATVHPLKAAVRGEQIRIALPPHEGILRVDPLWQDTTTAFASHDCGTSTTLSSGKILIAGGFGGTSVLAHPTIELFDPVSETFELVGQLTTPRCFHTATLLPDGEVLIVGGGVPAPGANAALNETSFERLDGQGKTVATGTFAPIGVALHTATRLRDGRVLVVGGTERLAQTDLTPVQQAVIYDPDEDAWSSLAVPAARAGHAAVRGPSGDVLLFGGLGAELAIDRFDVATASFVSEGVLAAPRAFAAATYLPGSGEILVTGGVPFGTPSAELLTPGSGPGTLLPTAQHHGGAPASWLPSGEVLLAGGIADLTELITGTDAVERFDPLTPAVVADESLPASALWPSVGRTFSGDLLLSSDLVGNPSQVARAAAPAVEPLAPPPLGGVRPARALSLLDGDVLLVEDASLGVFYPEDVPVGGTPIEAAIYDAESASFATVPWNPIYPRWGASHLVLDDGKVLITGGQGELYGHRVPLDRAEIWDPKDGSFEEVGPMVERRWGHSMVRLADGKVLLTGGWRDRLELLPPPEPPEAPVSESATYAHPTSEIYDPEDETFTPFDATLETGRAYHATTTLPDGRIVAVGGCTDVGEDFAGWEPVVDVEVLDPVTKAWTALDVTIPGSYTSDCVAPAVDAQVLPSGRVAVSEFSQTQQGPLFSIVTFDVDAPDPELMTILSESEVAGEPSTSKLTILPTGELLVTDPNGRIYAVDPDGASEPEKAAWRSGIGAGVALLADGSVLMAGGDLEPPLLPGDGSALHGLRYVPRPMANIGFRPVLAAPDVVAIGEAAPLSGTGLLGASEAGGGFGAPAMSYPLGLFVSDATGLPVPAPLHDWSDSAASWTPLPGTPTGPGVLLVAAGGVVGVGQRVVVKGAAVATPCGLDGDCASGHCSGGVCCEADCGPCGTCAAAFKIEGPDGTCGPVASGLDPDDACPQALPSTCGTTGVCDGAGQCASYDPGTVCDEGTGFCFDGECAERACDGEHTVWLGQGLEHCEPYRCDTTSDACLDACTTSLDCVDGFRCDAEGRCVGAPSGAERLGCTPCAVGRRSGDRGAAWLWLAGWVLVTRRRRAGSNRRERS